MPPLTSLSKDDLVDRLTGIIRKQDEEIIKLEALVSLMEKKDRHGCYGMHCQACDGVEVASES